MRPARRIDGKRPLILKENYDIIGNRPVLRAVLPKRARSSTKVRKSLKQNLIEELGHSINNHLIKLEAEINQTDYLKGHDISADYRAKMVDWMVEVMTTFKASDASFFVAASLMDRYFKNAEVNF